MKSRDIRDPVQSPVREDDAAGAGRITTPQGLNDTTHATPSSPAAQGPAPSSIGGFRIEKLLGQGGMGSVYLAKDEHLGRSVAIKTMRHEVASHPGAAARFLREARLAAQVEHDNIIPVWQVGEDNGTPFIAMPLLHGESLADRLKREEVPPIGVALKVGRETAAGLAAAHARGLVHRDIKPANLWLEGDLTAKDPASRFRRVRVLDFGLARPVNDAVQLTASGAMIGTPAYMSPEQAQGGEVDFRTDLFSLGSVLYQLTTGKAPFPGHTVMGILTNLAVHTPRPPADVNPKIPRALSELIMKLLSKDPAGRPKSADEVATSLRTIGRELAETRKSGAGPVPAAMPEKRRPRLSKKVALLLLATACLIVAAGITIKVTKRDGSVTTVRVPDGSVVHVDAQGDVDVALPRAKPVESAPSAPVGPDRAVALAVLKCGGWVAVRVNGKDQSVTKTAELPNEPLTLVHFTVQDQPTVPADFPWRRLSECRSIDAIHFANVPITDDLCDHFPRTPSFGLLLLSNTQVTATGLANAARFPGLGSLYLPGSPVTDAALAKLGDIPGLRSLDLGQTRVTDAGLAHLEQFRNLEWLALPGNRISNAGLVNLKSLSNLANLNLHMTDVDDAGMDHLSDLPALSHLTLTSTSLSDSGVAKIAGLPKLSSLKLDGIRITDVALVSLAKSHSLTELWLLGTKITDAGLESLAGLKSLRTLALPNEAVTPAAVAKLQKALPDCKIHYDERK